MKKFLKFVDRLDGYIAATFLLFTIVLLSTQVFNRYVLGISFAWVEELSRFCFVWCVYFGVSMAVRSGEHVRIVAHLKAFLNAKAYTIIVVVADLIWLVFSCVMLVASIQFLGTTAKYPFISPAMGVSMLWVYMIVPLVFTLMIVRLIQINYLKFRSERSVVNEEPIEPGL
ncbi:MAG: C4-dicarboxylate ABC transporter permease [Opitutaceae bacterium]|nr:C4-dicarboxylate ABC transporter permease [Opitutaceae bacterium]|tara:strand:+ start:1894 stop:2406 length:513 start_codon:yes stop_codon:yes gene_type:complete